MRHRVSLSQRAERDIAEAYAFIAQDAPQQAEEWRGRLMALVETLERFPLRHPLAPEANATGIAVRQFCIGVYRVLYVVERDMAQILTVRHGARRFLEPEEIGGASKEK